MSAREDAVASHGAAAGHPPAQPARGGGVTSPGAPAFAPQSASATMASANALKTDLI